VTSPHFAWLPPEINSALIHAGPGAAPLLAAAEAWDGLAENLASSASSFFSVTSDLLNGSWQGASATAMMSVASQYVSWLGAAAAQAEAASAQASAIATAFESALAATVQPAVVGANRAFVRVLASTNWFGMNTPAIMDTESAYEQMWAADVGAMFGYHADASTALAQLPPWQQVMQQLGLPFSAAGGAHAAPPATSGTATATAGTAPATAGTASGTAGTASGSSNAANAGSQSASSGSSTSASGGWGGAGNLFGLGGLNSGTGNIGLFNSGNNNIGFFNSGNNNIGIGNTGNLNTGLANTGTANVGLFGGTGVFQSNGATVGAGADPLGSGHYLTGGLSAAGLGTGLLNTAAASTGGIFPSVASAAVFNPLPAGAAAFSAPTDLGSIQASVASPAGGPTPIPPALRTTTAAPAAFMAAPASGSAAGGPAVVGGDAGARTPIPARGQAIPETGFFKDQRTAAESGPVAGEPESAN